MSFPRKWESRVQFMLDPRMREDDDMKKLDPRIREDDEEVGLTVG